jgi:hemerythrin-like domain-containing protein
MKRSEALVPLGHDHHAALEAALRLRRATVDDLDAAVARFRDFWTEHTRRRHFEIEEELLLPALAGDTEWDEMAARIRRDHEQIRARAGTLATVADANSLGQLLNDHVRFEEREVFELLEARLDPGRLAELGAEIRAAR